MSLIYWPNGAINSDRDLVYDTETRQIDAFLTRHVTNMVLKRVETGKRKKLLHKSVQ